MRSTHPPQPRKNTQAVNKITDNINKKKFTTNIDDEADQERLKNEMLSKRKNMTSVEPFWSDFNTAITDICQQKEAPAKNGLANGRNRGPSQPNMRNQSKNNMAMNQTLNSFKMGQGSVESDQSGLMGNAATS